MIEILAKPSDQITPADIQALIDKKVPEGESIEYKMQLAHKGDGSPNPWMSGENDIGDKAKNELLREAVAFANGHGGALVLGISESEEKPPMADGISLIPRCIELADRLSMVFRNRVEPKIPRIETIGVPICGDSGVVVLRIGGRSRLAPHRVTKLLVCPIRRQDRCENMTMLEIQDMTLNLSRGLDRLERLFTKRSDRFEEEFKSLKNPFNAIGIRATAAPVADDIWFERVYHNREILPSLHEHFRKVIWHRDGRKPEELVYPIGEFSFHWRPALRAARGDSDNYFSNRYSSHLRERPEKNAYKEVHCDGLVELGLISHRYYREPYENFLSPDLLLAMFANLLTSAHLIRTQAGIPVAEYAIEVVIEVKGFKKTLGRPGQQYGDPIGYIDPGKVEFHRFPLGDSENITDILNQFYRDLYNALGRDVDTDKDQLRIENWTV